MNVWQICQKIFLSQGQLRGNLMFSGKGSALQHTVIHRGTACGRKCLGTLLGMKFKAKQLGLYVSFASVAGDLRNSFSLSSGEYSRYDTEKTNELATECVAFAKELKIHFEVCYDISHQNINI